MTSNHKLRSGANKVLGYIRFGFYRYCFLNDVVGHTLVCGWAVSFPELVSGCSEQKEAVPVTQGCSQAWVPVGILSGAAMGPQPGSSPDKHEGPLAALPEQTLLITSQHLTGESFTADWSSCWPFSNEFG